MSSKEKRRKQARTRSRLRTSSRAAIDDFASRRRLAVVGLSRSGEGFGRMAYRILKRNGYTLFPVHPEAQELEGDRAHASLAALPERVEGVLVVVPPEQALRVVQDAAAAGIGRVWLQQGAESPEAVRFCEEHGVRVVYGRCILMFAEPVGFGHRLHRWFTRLGP